MSSSSSRAPEESVDEFEYIRRTINLAALSKRALEVRLSRGPPEPPATDSEFPCTVDPAPKTGSYNAAYTIHFPDGLR